MGKKFKNDHEFPKMKNNFIENIKDEKYFYSYPSLNLSHAVSIALYELNKSSKRNFDQELKVFNLASSKQIHDSFLEIEELLLKVGYFLKHTSKAKISKFKEFILRSNTSMHEISVLRGIVHQINWFLNNSKKNK